MPQTFQTIGLVGKSGDPGVAETLHNLGAHLAAAGYQLLLDADTGQHLPGHGLPTETLDELGKRCDLVIVVGGDGTLLHAAHSLAEAGPALVGINRGRLGFLVDISPDDMIERVDRILAGEYHEEERILLCASIANGDDSQRWRPALNDVVIHKYNTARMIEFETRIDGQFVNTQRSDGLIVSSPTGSTAYALSGGGPIVHPGLNAMVLVPICPHTLSSRPLVVGADSVIEIVIGEGLEPHTQITCDGQSTLNLRPGERITIRKRPRGVRLLHPPGYDYYELLRAKLRWAGHH